MSRMAKSGKDQIMAEEWDVETGIDPQRDLIGPAGPKLRNRTNFRTYHEQRLYSERFSLKFRCKLRGGGYFDGEYWP